MLATAARLDPANTQYSYVYAVGLNDFGRTAEAIGVLKENVRMHRFDRDSLAALVGYFQRAGESTKALSYAQHLKALDSQPREAATVE
jgi:hypothetical protein